MLWPTFTAWQLKNKPVEIIKTEGIRPNWRKTLASWQLKKFSQVNFWETANKQRKSLHFCSFAPNALFMKGASVK